MKTTLRKLISEIDFNNKEIQDEPDFSRLGNIFNIYDLHYSNDTRLKSYFIRKWYCTDSYVGLKAYFLDGEFIATSWQSGRKMDEEFTFVSKEKALKLKIYLESLVEEDSGVGLIDLFKEKDLDEEISNTFKIEYNSQILHRTGLLKGERVEILKKRYSWEDKENYFHTVKIKKQDGIIEEIDCRELDFEYNV
jgi:hypothetical protein